MTSAKVAISMPDSVLRLARDEVKAGRAKSLSALVSEAVDEKLRRDELEAVLDAMDLELGPPGAEAKAWARRLLRRSSSTRAR
jgi:Arc/MetJ-type ribon-helix-helix transcriptional regulator